MSEYSFVHQLVNFDTKGSTTKTEVLVENLDWKITNAANPLPQGIGGMLVINGGVWQKDFNLTNTYQRRFNLSELYFNETKMTVNHTGDPL